MIKWFMKLINPSPSPKVDRDDLSDIIIILPNGTKRVKFGDWVSHPLFKKRMRSNGGLPEVKLEVICDETK